MKLFITLSLLVLLSEKLMAQTVYSEQFQRVTSIELLEVTTDEQGRELTKVIDKLDSKGIESMFLSNETPKSVNIGSVIMMTKSLIALGKEVYKIVEAGKPVLNVDSEPIDILPKDSKGQAISAMQLQGWSDPVVKKFRVAVKNYMGITPASFDFLLIFSHSGNINGKGRYITGAELKPTRIDVKWGYNLDVNFKLDTIMNQGSSKNPVAGAVMSLNYNISTVLQTKTGSYTYFINGLGKVKSY